MSNEVKLVKSGIDFIPGMAGEPGSLLRSTTDGPSCEKSQSFRLIPFAGVDDEEVEEEEDEEEEVDEEIEVVGAGCLGDS